MSAAGGSTIDTVIFDLDGTLVDSLGDIAAAVNAGFGEAGLAPRSPEDIKLKVGWGMRSLVAALLPGADGNYVDGLAERIKAAYALSPAALSRPYGGIAELLGALRSRGVATAVLSNKPDELVPRVLSLLFPEHSFDAARGLKPGFPPKPDPAQCLDLLAFLGSSPERAVLVGDSAVDVRTARAAGAAAVACLWGYRPAEELAAAAPDFTARSPRDVLDALDALSAMDGGPGMHMKGGH